MTEAEMQKEIAAIQERNRRGVYVPDPSPVSAFMAGSPGAGKTEFSKNLIEILEKKREHRGPGLDAYVSEVYTRDNLEQHL